VYGAVDDTPLMDIALMGAPSFRSE
jgi:hypothetical protein